MHAIGNFLTIFGIGVTFVSYYAQQSVTLADVEPGLVKRWRRGRSWVLRKFGRNDGMVAYMGRAEATAICFPVVVWSWSSVQPEDDLAVRVEKLEHNLEQVRKNFGELRDMDTQHLREVSEGLATRLKDLKRVVNEHQQQSRRETTTAMRWEVRGLMLTLLGAVVSVIW